MKNWWIIGVGLYVAASYGMEPPILATTDSVDAAILATDTAPQNPDDLLRIFDIKAVDDSAQAEIDKMRKQLSTIDYRKYLGIYSAVMNRRGRAQTEIDSEAIRQALLRKEVLLEIASALQEMNDQEKKVNHALAAENLNALQKIKKYVLGIKIGSAAAGIAGTVTLAALIWQTTVAQEQLNCKC